MADTTLNLVLQARNLASREIQAVQRDIGSLEKQSGLLGTAMKAAAAVAATTAAAIAFTGKAALNAAAELEQQKVAFTTMLGSADAANKLLNELSDFAQRTPFELQGIRQNAKQLLAMGIESDNLMPTLKALGDVSAGLSVPLERLALNYGQVAAQGKLTGRELKDFAVAGVPLLDQLSKQMGKSKAEIQDMISDGAIGFPIVEKAFKDMTDEGGRFNDLMDKQSKTFKGMVSNLSDGFTRFLETSGGDFIEWSKDVVQILIDFVTNDLPKWYEGAKKAFNKFKSYLESLYTDIRKSTDRLLIDWNSLWDQMKTKIVEFGDILIKKGGDSFTRLYDLAVSFLNFFYAIWETNFGGLREYITIWWNYVVGLFEANLDILRGALTFFSGLFSADWEKMWDGIKLIVSGAVNFIVSFINKIIGAINMIPGINIPLVPKIDTSIIGVQLKDLGEKGVAAGAALGALGRATKEMANESINLSEKTQNISKNLDNLGGSSKSAKNYVDELHGKFTDFTDDTTKRLESMAADYLKTFNNIKETISSINQEIATLTEQFNTQQLSDRQKMAEEIVKQEENIKNIQGEFNKETDADKKEILRQRLIAEKDALEKHKDLQMSLESEVTEAKRRSLLTSFERVVEDFQKRRQLATEEYNKELEQLKQRKVDLQTHLQEVSKEYFANKAEIVKILDALSVDYENNLKERTKVTKIQLDEVVNAYEEAQKQIERIQKRFSPSSAIKGARASGGFVESGSTYMVGERGAELFSPTSSGYITPNNKMSGGGGGVIINVQGNFVGSEEEAEKFGDMILRKLQSHSAVIG